MISSFVIPLEKEKSNLEKGTVISQNPGADAKIKTGESVDIVLSEGNNETPVVNNPSNDTPSDNPQNAMKKKTLTISIPDSAGETVSIRVVANGKEIWNKVHQKSEGKVDITVQSSKDAEVEVYMDNELVVHKIIEF